MLRDVIIVLATQGWQKLVDEEEMLVSKAKNADDLPESHYLGVEHFLTGFKTPLMSASADLDSILPEFRAMVEYAAQFLFPGYNRLQKCVVATHCPSASEWENCFILVERLYSWPVSNGKVESQLNTIKKERSLLSNNLLGDLLLLSSDAIPLREFNPDDAIDLWWQSKVPQPNQPSQ